MKLGFFFSFSLFLVVLFVKDDYYQNIYVSHIYLYKSGSGFSQKRILYLNSNPYQIRKRIYYIFKTLLNNNNLNSNPYQIRKRIYYIFKTLLNNNNLNSNPYQIRKQIYIIIYLTITVTITVM